LNVRSSLTAPRHNRTEILPPLYRSGLLDTSSWNAACAVTLTVKQAIWSDGYRITADEHHCSRAFNHFMNRLNRAIYGKAFRRYGKRLRVIPVLEKDGDGRFHFHAAVEHPEHVTAWRFEMAVRESWCGTDWACDRISIEFRADEGWVDYMLKPRQKSGLDAWSDCIDWSCFFNPIAGVALQDKMMKNGTESCKAEFERKEWKGRRPKRQKYKGRYGPTEQNSRYQGPVS